MDQPHHTAACFAPPAALAAYRALWAEVWQSWRGVVGLDCRTVNQEVRAVALALLVEGVPADAAGPIILQFMKGLKA